MRKGKDIKNNSSYQFVEKMLSDKRVDCIDAFHETSLMSLQGLLPFLPPKISALYKNNAITFLLKSGEYTKKIVIRYNPKANFDYLRTDVSKHDGTMLFLYEGMTRCLNPLANGTSYFSLDETVYTTDKYWAYDNYYDIGDFVIDCEYGNFGKSFLQERQCIFLPVKCSLVKRGAL